MRFEPQFQISRNLINPRVYRSKVLSWQIIYFLFMFKEKLFLARYFGNSWENLVRWKYKILTGSTLETTKEVRLEKSRFRHIFRVRSNLILLYRCLYLFCVLKQLTKKKGTKERFFMKISAKFSKKQGLLSYVKLDFYETDFPTFRNCKCEKGSSRLMLEREERVVSREFSAATKTESRSNATVNGNLPVIGSCAVKFASGVTRINAGRSRFSRVNTTNPTNRAW